MFRFESELDIHQEVDIDENLIFHQYVSLVV